MKNLNQCSWLSPCEHVKDFLRYKAPLVLFALSLFVLAVAFVGVTSYVRSNSAIVDPNYHTDWGAFLSSLESIEWSTGNESVKNVKMLPTPAVNLTHHVFVAVNVSNSRLQIKSGSIYQSTVWKERLLPKELLKKNQFNVTVSFSCLFHKTSKCDSVKTHEGETLISMCLNISSDQPFLSPDLTLPEQCQPSSDVKSVQSVFASDKPSSSPRFHTVYSNAPQHLKMFLSDEDRRRIHIHLMSSSYILFILVSTVLVCGVLCKRKNHQPSEDEASANLLTDGNEVT